MKRIVGGETYTLTHDAENHLTEVMTAGGTLAAFGYGPGGERITGTVGATTTVYVGARYEVQGVGQAEVVRKYYYAGARRVAMREGETLYFLLSDHLGSQAVTAHGTTGAKVAEVRYGAWGEDRYITGTMPTSFRFTGQRSEAGIGLYYYGARWYDPYIQRWISPDTISPDPGDPQGLNRYSYVLNCPTRYQDPTGHCIPGVNCPGHQSEIGAGPPIAPEGSILVGLTSIPTMEDDLSQVGVLDVNYGSDFGTLGSEGGPAVTIVYKAPALDPRDLAAWSKLDSRDLLARTLAQEAAYGSTEKQDVEMMGYAQNACERLDQKWEPTLNEVLLGGYALGPNVPGNRNARANWADPVGNPRYERALAISVGVHEGWLYDPRTAGYTFAHGHGTYSTFNNSQYDTGGPSYDTYP